MSVYGTIPGIDDDAPCGPPWVYQGSHILPAEEDERGGEISLASIAGHITRDGRDDQPEDGRPWPWLRVSVDQTDAIIDPVQARYLGELLIGWADQADGVDEVLVESNKRATEAATVADLRTRFDHRGAQMADQTAEIRQLRDALAVVIGQCRAAEQRGNRLQAARDDANRQLEDTEQLLTEAEEHNEASCEAVKRADRAEDRAADLEQQVLDMGGHQLEAEQLRAQLDRVRAELDRLTDLDTATGADGRAGQFSTGARWAIRMIRTALDQPEEQPAVPARHVGGRVNAEDCAGCRGTNPAWPFICPGEGPDDEETPSEAGRADRQYWARRYADPQQPTV